MRYVQLGKTDLIVSRICFGCWQLSPRFWGDVSMDDWRAAVRKAPEVGVNFIDTADAYGDGAAESALGDLLAEDKTRDSFIVATKFYHNFEKAERHPDTSYDYILRECEASLKRLRTDRIDLYQIHAWDPLTRPDEVAAAFGQLKKQGKVRWFGVSNLNADQIRMYLRYCDIECLQPLYNMLAPEVEARELPVCVENRMGVISYSSLARGLLTGKYTPEAHFGDFRDDDPYFHGESYEAIKAGLDKLKPYCEKYRLTLPQFAVRWVLTHPAITSAIIGVKKPDHIESIAPAADGVLTNEDWHSASSIMATAGAAAKAARKKSSGTT